MFDFGCFSRLSAACSSCVFWPDDSVVSETDPGGGGVAVNVPVGESANGASEEGKYSFFLPNAVAAMSLLGGSADGAAEEEH